MTAQRRPRPASERGTVIEVLVERCVCGTVATAEVRDDEDRTDAIQRGVMMHNATVSHARWRARHRPRVPSRLQEAE